MASLLAPLLSYVLLYKYFALGFIVYSAAVIIPWPSNALLLAVGAFSSQGYFSFWFTLLLAVVLSTLGDLTDYFLARKFGEPIIKKLRFDRVRFFVQLKEELRTDAAVTVFTTRFAGSLSTVANFLAGLVDVPVSTFLWYDLLGNFIEPFVALSLGYAVGNYWNDFSNILGLLTGIVAVSVILFILVRMYRRMARKYSP